MSKSYEIVYLPMDEAVALEAKQNRERDARVLGEDDCAQMSVYEEEAKYLMVEYGEGYIPDYDDHKHVFLKK